MPEEREKGSERKSGFEEAREHAHAAAACARKGLEAVLPASFVEHRRAARREMLLAVRSLLDAALERTEPPKK